MSLTKIYHNLASSWASKRPWESYNKRFFFGGNAKNLQLQRDSDPTALGFWMILAVVAVGKKIPLFHLVESTSSNLRFLIFCSSWIWGSKPQHMSFIEICWDGIRFTSILIRFNKDILNNSSQTNHLRFLRSGKCRAGFEFFFRWDDFVDSTLIFHFILTSFASIPWIFAILHGHHLISTLGSRLRSPLSSLATWSRGMDCCPMAESSMWHWDFCCTQSSNHLEKPHLKVEHHENVMKSCDLKVFSSRNSLCAWGGRPNSPPFRSTILGAAWPICYQPPLNSSNIPPFDFLQKIVIDSNWSF